MSYLHAHANTHTHSHRQTDKETERVRESWHTDCTGGFVMKAWYRRMQADDPSNSDAPALQVPKDYETGLINAFKQAVPQYISNALAMGR